MIPNYTINIITALLEKILIKSIKHFFEPLIYLWNNIGYDPINDIPTTEDLRSKLDKRGVITKCFYCIAAIRIDGNNGDHNPNTNEEYHCSACEDIYEGNYSDYRQDDTQRGNIAACYYCRTAILIDGTNDPQDDYEISEPEIHCDECMNSAIRNLT